MLPQTSTSLSARASPSPQSTLNMSSKRSQHSSTLFAPLGTQSLPLSSLPLSKTSTTSPLGSRPISPINVFPSNNRPLSPIIIREHLLKNSLSNTFSLSAGTSPTSRSSFVGSNPSAAQDIADLAISAVALAEQQNIQRSRDHFLRQSRERGRRSSSGLSGRGSGLSTSAEQVIDSVVDAFLLCGSGGGGGGGGSGEGHCSLMPVSNGTISRSASPTSPFVLQSNAPRCGTPVSDSEDEEEEEGRGGVLNAPLADSSVTSCPTTVTFLSTSSVSISNDGSKTDFQLDENSCDNSYLITLLAKRKAQRKSTSSSSSTHRPERSPSEVVKKGGKGWKDGCKCDECNSAFSMSIRKHHCRACGSVLCKPCVPYRNFELQFTSSVSNEDNLGANRIKSLFFSRLCLQCHALACGRVLSYHRCRNQETYRLNSDDILSWLDCIASCDLKEVETRIRMGQDVNAAGCVSVDGATALHIASGIPAFATTTAISQSNFLKVNTSSSSSSSVSLSASGSDSNANTVTSAASPSEKPHCASVGFCLSSIPELIGNFIVKRSSNMQVSSSIPISYSSSSSFSSSVTALTGLANPSNGGNIYLSCSTSSEAERTHFALLHCLIQAGADVHAVTNSKRTPLHCAAAFGTPRVVEFLLANGALQNVIDKNGLSPFDYAQMRAARGDIVGRCILLDGLLTSLSTSSSLLIEHAKRLSQCEADTAARRRLAMKIQTDFTSDANVIGTSSFIGDKEDVRIHGTSTASSRMTLDSLLPINRNKSVGNSNTYDVCDFFSDSLSGVLLGSQDVVIKRAVELARLEPLPSLRCAQVSALNIHCLAQAAQDLQRNLVSVRNGHDRYIYEQLWPLVLHNNSEEDLNCQYKSSNSSLLFRAAQTGLIGHRNVISLLSPKLSDLSVHTGALIGKVWLLGHKPERGNEGLGMSVGIALAERAERRLEMIQGKSYIRPIGLRRDVEEEEEDDDDEEEVEDNTEEEVKPEDCSRRPQVSTNEYETTSIPPPMLLPVSLSNVMLPSTHSVTAPLSLSGVVSPPISSHGLRISIQRSATAPTNGSSTSFAAPRRPVQSLPNIKRTQSLVNEDCEDNRGSSLEFPIMNRLNTSSSLSSSSSSSSSSSALSSGLTLSMPRLRIPQDPEVAAHFRAKELEKELEKERQNVSEDIFLPETSSSSEFLRKESVLHVETTKNSYETNATDSTITTVEFENTTATTAATSTSTAPSVSLNAPLLTLKIRSPSLKVDVVEDRLQSSMVEDTSMTKHVHETETTFKMEITPEVNSITVSTIQTPPPSPLKISTPNLRCQSISGNKDNEMTSLTTEKEMDDLNKALEIDAVNPHSKLLIVSSLPSSQVEPQLMDSFVDELSNHNVNIAKQDSIKVIVPEGLVKEVNEQHEENLSSTCTGGHMYHIHGRSNNGGHHAHGHRGHKHHHGHRHHSHRFFTDTALSSTSQPDSSLSTLNTVLDTTTCATRHSFHGWLHGGRSKPFHRHGSESDGVAALAPKSCLKSHSSSGRMYKLEIESSVLIDDHQKQEQQQQQQQQQQQLLYAVRLLEKETLSFPLTGSQDETDPQQFISSKLSSPTLTSRTESPMFTSFTSPSSSLSSRSSSIGVDESHTNLAPSSTTTSSAVSVATSSAVSVAGLSVETSASDPATASSIFTTSSSTRSISLRNQQLSLGISLPTLKPQTSYGYDGMLAFDAPPSPNWSQMNSAGCGNSSGGNFFFSALDNAAPASPSNSVDNSSTPQQEVSPNDSPLLRSTAIPSYFPGGLLLSEVRSRTMSEFSISSVTSTGVRPSRSVSFLDFEPARDVIVFKPTALIAPPVDSNPLSDSGAESGGDSSVTHTSSGVSDDDALAEEMDDEDDDAYYSSTRSDQSIDGSAADDDDGELGDRSDVGHIESTYSHHIESGLGGRLMKMHYNSRQRHGKGDGKVKKEEANMRVSILARSFSATSTTSSKTSNSNTSKSLASSRRRSGSPMANAGSRTARAINGEGLPVPGSSTASHRRIALARAASDVEKQRGGHGYHHNLVSTTRPISTLDSDSDDDSEGGYGSDDDSDGGCGAPIATAVMKTSIPSLSSKDDTGMQVQVTRERECSDLPAAVIAAIEKMRLSNTNKKA